MERKSFCSFVIGLIAVLVLTVGCGDDNNNRNGGERYAVPPSQNCLNYDDPRCFNYNNTYGSGFYNYPYNQYPYNGQINPGLCNQWRGNYWNVGWDPYRSSAFCFHGSMYGNFNTWGFQAMCDVRNPGTCPWGSRCVQRSSNNPIGFCQ